MGALQPMHRALILFIALIVCGPGKLTDAFGQLGRGLREFRDPSGRPAGASYYTSCGRSLTVA